MDVGDLRIPVASNAGGTGPGDTSPPGPALRKKDARPGDGFIAWPLGLVATILGLILLAWAILFITKGRFLKGPFERIVSAQLQRDVRVGGDFNLYFNPIQIQFLAEKMTISNPEWAKSKTLFKADRIDSKIATFTLLSDPRRINWLGLANGSVDLEWSKDGQQNTWTFGDGKKRGEPLSLPVIRRALVNGTRVRYTDPRMQLMADIGIDTVKARDTQFETDVRFSGSGSMRGKPFTLSGGLLSPNETVTGGRNQLALRAVAGPTVVEVDGTLPGATVIEGADLRMVTHGPNLSLLFDFLGVAIPDTRRYRIASHLTKAEGEWRFTGLRGRFGDSDLAGRLIVRPPGAGADSRLKLTADLSTDTLDILDIGPVVGYNPQRLEAQGKAGMIEQVGGTPRILPDAPLRVDAISRFDADVKYRVRRVRAENFPISNIGLTLKLDRSLLSLSPLTFDMSGGFVSSDIIINARRRPVLTSYDIRLSPTPMGKLLGRWGVEESGTTGVIKARIRMTGLGDSVRESLATSNGRIAVVLPAGTMWARNIQLAELDIGTFITKMFEKKLKEPVQINCGLIAFTVRDGVAAADPILIDTSKNVMLGRGGFSFRNESMDLAFRADGKKFSLFSGQSPVGINGYFAKPGVDVISGDLIARAGAGVGLGIVASPLASVLAFVDVGDAKAAACGPVLSAATAQAQRTTKGQPRDDVGRGTTAKSESGKQSPQESGQQKKKFLGIF